MPRSAALLLLLSTACVYCLAVLEAVGRGATSSVLGVAPHKLITSTAMIQHRHSRRLVELTSILRGGASVDTDDDDEEDESEESEYDEDEEEESMITHAASAPSSTSSNATTKRNKVTLVTSTKKLIQQKQTTAMKSQINKAVSVSSSYSSSSSPSSSSAMKKKSSATSLYKRYVPYIIRATLNPITLWTMTKAYFVSLCDINYGKEEQSQTLRSALQQKAKNQPPPPKSSGKKRKFKPGQAKTLSDLPQLSA